MQGISQRERNGRCPGFELLIRGRIAGAIAFVDAIRAHCPPLVMVAGEPNFGKITKPPITGYFRGWKMRVIVEDRFIRGVTSVKAAGSFGMQQKVFVDETQNHYSLAVSPAVRLCCHRYRRAAD